MIVFSSLAVGLWLAFLQNLVHSIDVYLTQDFSFSNRAKWNIWAGIASSSEQGVTPLLWAPIVNRILRKKMIIKHSCSYINMPRSSSSLTITPNTIISFSFPQAQPQIQCKGCCMLATNTNNLLQVNHKF